MSTIDTHVVDFEDLRIEYDERVLTPRPWTAAQSHWAADLIRVAPPGPVLELCSGAGHIGLLAISLAPRRLVCVDADPVACGFLRRNAAKAGIRVDVREGPMDRVLDGDEKFAVVIADPPWVPTTEVREYPEDPVPRSTAEKTGSTWSAACLDVLDRHLAEAGAALLQVGPDGQADRLADLVADYDDLAVVEVREFERGALVQIDRVTG